MRLALIGAAAAQICCAITAEVRHRRLASADP